MTDDCQVVSTEEATMGAGATLGGEVTTGAGTSTTGSREGLGGF